MKAIVANVLFGSILGCLSSSNPACAKPLIADSQQFQIPKSPQLLSSNKLPIVPQIINLVDRIFTINKSNTSNFTIDEEAQIVFSDRFSLNLTQERNLALGKVPYTHQDSQGDLILGFQTTFWQSDSNQKYWGITTIEHWGEGDRTAQTTNLAKLNYTQLSPALPSGNSTLTLSGGGNRNLAEKNNISREFEQFRGGVSYHRGVVDDVTMGVGFVYEDYFIGFTQLTYNSPDFPFKSTVSLLAQESGLDFSSHVRFKPAENFVLNYYRDREKNQFDANWNVLSGLTGLTLLAGGDLKNDSFSTGIKVAVHNDYMSISAKAILDSDNNFQWNLKSNIGGIKFVYGNTKEKNTSQIDLSLIESDTFNFRCSAFIKYENAAEHNEDKFLVWGSKIQSSAKITPSQHLWSVNLGYGNSPHGRGLIASGSVGLKPNMFLKLSYQEISATSNDTKIKLQISSE